MVNYIACVCCIVWIPDCKKVACFGVLGVRSKGRVKGQSVLMFR